MSSQPVVTLSQQDVAEQGLNINWALNAYVIKPLKEITLIYYKSDSDAQIQSKLIDSEVDNISLDLDAGVSYYLQLQVLDGSNTTIYSNVILCTTPAALPAPVIKSIDGLDNALRVNLDTNVLVGLGLTNSDSVEFVLRKSLDNSLFWMVLPYSSAGVYDLTNALNSKLYNNTSYKVACMIQPGVNNSTFKAPSPISNTMSAMPSNIPNASTDVHLIASYDRSNPTIANVQMTWIKPSDYNEWSSSAVAKVYLLNTVSNQSSTFTLQNPAQEYYVFANIDRNGQYNASVQYFNSYGAGPICYAGETNTIPVTVPDAPTVAPNYTSSNQSATFVFSAPAYTGNDPLVGLRVYGNSDGNNPSLIATLSPSATSYTWTGLTNGTQYRVYLTAYNQFGESPKSSDVLNVVSKSDPIVQSVTVSGNILNIVCSPNGSKITKLIALAISNNPSVNDSFVITQDITNTAIGGTINLNASFGFPVDKYVVLVKSDVGSAYSTNIQL